MRTNLHVGPSCRVITTNGVTFCFIDAVPKNLRSKEYKTPKCLKANVFKIVNIIVLNTELAYLSSFPFVCRWFLPRDAICTSARPMPSCGVYLSVSVTFVNCDKTNKHIIKIFSPSGKPIILVFLCQTA